MPTDLTVRELDPSTWSDFEALFRRHGTPGSCWCMYYRRDQSAERERAEYRVPTGGFPEHNRKRKRGLVDEGRAHGILVYDGERAVGWCAYGPADEFPRIDRGRFYRKLAPPLSPGNAWRITCFVVDKGHRGRGIASFALRAALDSIRRQGGGTVEAYPVASTKGGSQSLWFGTVPMFEREGFERVARLGASVLMRRALR